MSRRDKRNLAVLSVFFIIAAMVFVVADEVHLHVITGLVLAVILVVHMAARGRQFLKCPSHLKRIDAICLAALFVMTISGFFIPAIQGSMLPLMIHKFSSAVLVLACIIHFVQHCTKRRK